MAITSADFDRVCTGDRMRIDYDSSILPYVKDDWQAQLPHGIDQAALRQSYAYAWAQTIGSQYGQDRRPAAMHVLQAPSVSVQLAKLSSKQVSCIGYKPSVDGKSLQEVVSTCTETALLSTTEVSSFQLSCDWRTMQNVQPQNAWCLLNTPGFTRFDGNSSGTMLNDTLDEVMDLHDQAKTDAMNAESRFFLSRESKDWLDSIDGKLLSAIETSSSLDLLPDEIFAKLLAPHLPAADFSTYLSSVVSNGTLLDPVFLNLSTVSSMYEPLVQLSTTSYLMEPRKRLLDAQLQAACHWEETEKYSGQAEPSKTSADFVDYIAGTDGYAGFKPACPASYYKYHQHMGYDGEGHAIMLDRDRTSYGDCQLSGYVESIGTSYDNRPALSAIEFRDNQWMRQRKTLGVKSQKLLVVTASIKKQSWSNQDQSESTSITAYVYADLVDMQEDAVRLSALAEDVVTRQDAQCMLVDVASTMPYEQRVELSRRLKDVQVDLPAGTVLWREDKWSKLDLPSPIWSALISHPPSLPQLHPAVELGWSSAEAWTGLVGCWAVTEADSLLAGLL